LTGAIRDLLAATSLRADQAIGGGTAVDQDGFRLDRSRDAEPVQQP